MGNTSKGVYATGSGTHTASIGTLIQSRTFTDPIVNLYSIYVQSRMFTVSL